MSLCFVRLNDFISSRGCKHIKRCKCRLQAARGDNYPPSRGEGGCGRSLAAYGNGPGLLAHKITNFKDKRQIAGGADHHLALISPGEQGKQPIHLL